MVTAAARRTERVAVAVLLAATAVGYLWNLGASGWANAFYSAAAQAGSMNWTAWLFGSSDPANAITVDKTPAALWVTGLSARIFGVNSWSILAPQAVFGVAAVAVLYATVRRISGPWAALLAAAILAATPAAALMFRFNNPDALLVLALVGAAYATQRALSRQASAWWLPLAGAAVGLGFLAKMMQAFLVLPGLAVAFAVAADLPWRTRICRLAGAALALVVSGGWYLVLVSVWSAAARPYIGGSQHNSIIELALGYNGLGRLTGDETGGLGNLNFDVGWARLLGAEMGPHVAWLLPAAVVGLLAGLWITRARPRTDVTRAALVLWGGWLTVTAVVFSFANGILHPYYTVALAPAVAATVSIGTRLLWQRRADPRAATVLSGTVAITAGLSNVLLQHYSHWLPWLRLMILIGGIAAALLLVVVARLPRAVEVTVAALAIVVALAGPVAVSVATASSPRSGAIPSVGPSDGGGGGMPGMFDAPRPGPGLVDALRVGSAQYTWAAAVIGSSNAAGYQLDAGVPVLAVGGFNGTDPAPTLQQFQDHVANGRIHWFIDSAMPGPGFAAHTGSDAADRIRAWVNTHAAARIIDGVTLYDLSQPLTGGS